MSYGPADYIRSLADFGTTRRSAHADGRVLERYLPGTAVTREDFTRMAGVMVRLPDHSSAVTAALQTRENET